MSWRRHRSVVERARVGGRVARDGQRAAQTSSARSSCAAGKASKPSRRRPRDRDRVDAVGLPAPASAAARVGHQLERDAQDRLAALDQNRSNEPNLPAVLIAHTRSPSSLRAQTTSAASPWRRPGPSARPSVRRRRRTAAIVRERLWLSAPSTIIDLVTSTSTGSDPGGHAGPGGATLLKSRRSSPTGDERHSKGGQATPSDSSEEPARRPVGTISSASDITDSPNRNSKPRSSTAARRRQAVSQFQATTEPPRHRSAVAGCRASSRRLHRSRSVRLPVPALHCASEATTESSSPWPSSFVPGASLRSWLSRCPREEAEPRARRAKRTSPCDQRAPPFASCVTSPKSRVRRPERTTSGSQDRNTRAPAWADSRSRRAGPGAGLMPLAD